MKVQSYTILHYGKDFLSYALRSVYDSVDQLNIFYTPTPSHGHSTDIPPIETKEELIQAAYAYDPDDKIKWYDMLGIYNEGTQRDTALAFCWDNGAELVVVVDYDEIWHKSQLELALAQVWGKNTRNHLVNMLHFWRSFDWVCRDNGWPVRIIDLRAGNRAVEYIPREVAQVYHFGYAVKDEIMKYKWQIHGHKNELRKGWLDNIWNGKSILERLDLDPSVHPTNTENFWIPEPFDKNELPECMRKHPFWELDKIE